MKSKLIYFLTVINLTLLAIILLSKVHFVTKIVMAVTNTFVVPLLLSALIYYIIRPINNIFIKKKISKGKSSLLTLLIFSFILSGLVSFFSKYVYNQFQGITKQLLLIVSNKRNYEGIISYVNNNIDLSSVFTILVGTVQYYFVKTGHIFMRCAGYCFNAFSMIFLIIVLVFYLLKDGDNLKGSILKFIPQKYKNISDEMLSGSDEILSHYVTGQAKVALSLAAMIFLGYLIIGMPNGIILAVLTFILAFIPFVGFFIAMIIPSIIALTMGYLMILKLIVVFIIVQTLKGRVVVPLVMSKTMDIHPITDIFLVIIAVAIGGPFAAFAIVPIYAIIKNAVIIIRRYRKE